MNKELNKPEIICRILYAKARCWVLANPRASALYSLVLKQLPASSAILMCLTSAFARPTMFLLTASLEVKMAICKDDSS